MIKVLLPAFNKRLFAFSMFLFVTVSFSFSQSVDSILSIPDQFLSQDFVGDGSFNAIVFGNLNANSGDSEGRLAVGGNFSFIPLSPAGYSVGIAGPGVGSGNAPSGVDNFVVNQNLHNGGNENWSVLGTMIYNTSSGNTLVEGNTILSGIENHILFEDLLTHYAGLSASLANIPSNGATMYPEYANPIILTGTDPVLNVFTIDMASNFVGSLLTNFTGGIEVNIPVGSTAIVNVIDSKPKFAGGQMMVNGVGIPTYGSGSKVLFNFPNADSLILSNFGLLASVLAPNAHLVGTGGSINGQAVIGGNVTQTGGFEFHNFKFTGEIPQELLPIKLGDFQVRKGDQEVILNWFTVSEINGSHFEIERSANAVEWTKIGIVESLLTRSEEKKYTFTDINPIYGISYYRLKMVDLDGSFLYSDIKTMEFTSKGQFSIFPNPSFSGSIGWNGVPGSEIKDVTIYEINGRIVKRMRQTSDYALDISGLQPGSYLIQFNTNVGKVLTEKLVVAE